MRRGRPSMTMPAASSPWPITSNMRFSRGRCCGLEQRREIEQRHDAAVQVHEAEQVGRHARQWIDVGHLDQLARGRERREQAHVADAKRLAHDVVRVFLDRPGCASAASSAGSGGRPSGRWKGGVHGVGAVALQAQAVMALRIWSGV